MFRLKENDTRRNAGISEMKEAQQIQSWSAYILTDYPFPLEFFNIYLKTHIKIIILAGGVVKVCRCNT